MKANRLFTRCLLRVAHLRPWLSAEQTLGVKCRKSQHVVVMTIPTIQSMIPTLSPVVSLANLATFSHSEDFENSLGNFVKN